jgi:hypothetical protein
MPTPCKVPATRLRTISPEMRASLPRTIFFLPVFLVTHIPKPAVNFKISAGVSPLPGVPPITPLIPDIDLINVTIIDLESPKIKIKGHLLQIPVRR